MIGVPVSASAWPAERSLAARCVRGRLTHGLENDDGNLACRAGLVAPVACIELDHAVPETLAFGAPRFSGLDPYYERSDLDLRLWKSAEVVEPRRMLGRPAVGRNDRIVRALSQVSEGCGLQLSGPSAGSGQQQHRQAQESPTHPAAAVAVDPSVQPPEQAYHPSL